MSEKIERMTELEPERLEVLLANSLEFMYHEFYGPAMKDQFINDLEYEIGMSETEMAVTAKPLIIFLDEQESNNDDEASKFYEEINEED